MLSISCEHPDLEEFIGIKSDLNRVTKANISIRITDKFMAAVKNKQPFTLSFTREETGETITKTVDAAEIFRKICEMNWDYAEPGMLFWDRIENWNLLSCDDNFHYSGVNPCFGGNAQLLTTEGYKTFEELEGTEPFIYNVNGNIVKSKVWCSGKKETVKVKTGKGEIICTPDHRFMTIDGDECAAKDLKGKYLMPCTNANKVFDDFYVKLGFIQGDGQLGRLKSERHDGIEVNIGKKDTDIYDLFSNEEFTIKSDRAIYVSGFKNKLIELGFSANNLPDREFPSTYKNWTQLQKASFLHGCYSANGSVIKNGRISYKTTCKKFAEQLLETLTEDFNIKGVYITTNRPHKVLFPNGEYECRESYDINIGQYKEITKFVSEINFYQQYKREQLFQMLRRRPSYVSSVEPNGIQKVYDFTEPERHWGIVEGYVVHNCAEEPLPAGGSCLLGSINLSEFVKDDKTFDFDSFDHAVSTAVIALNEVLDEGLPLHPLQEQRESVRDWRQIGLGIMGLADMLIKMGVRYGSKESINVCDAIGFRMAYKAIETSSELSLVKGSYPKFNYDVVSQSAYFSKHDPGINGLCNSQLLTTAPTGCQKPNTLVATNKGLLRLDELVNINGDKWQNISDIDAFQEKSSNKILKGFVNGEAKTKLITLSNNLQLEATPNHRYRIIRNNEYIWCRADEIVSGDIIPSRIGYYNSTNEYKLKKTEQTSYNGVGIFIKEPETLYPDLAFILGAYYANGSNHYRYKDGKFCSIRFSMNTDKEEDINKLAKKINDVFGINVTFGTSSFGSCTEIYVNNRNLCKWLELNKLKKDKSTNSTIPLAIRCSSVESIKSYFEGYYMCDGSYSCNNKYIDTSNYENAQDMVVILRAIGIDARIYIDTKRSGAKSKNPMYRVYIGGFKSLNFDKKYMRYIRKEDRIQLQNIKKLLGDDFIYDTVKEIRESFGMTLDVEVETNHCYLANGVVSHNTLSTMLGISGGIEPIYANYYTRKTESLHGHDEYYKVYTPIVKKYMEENNLTDDSQLPDIFVTAQNLNYRERIDMQAIWQSHIDASISSTVNVPHDFTIEETEDLYMYAWEKGLKGVTIFRNGCKRAGILSTETTSKDSDSKDDISTSSNDQIQALPRGLIIKADDNCIGKKRTLRTGCGTLHCKAFFDPSDGQLLETYFSKGGLGGCGSFMCGLSRMISLAARGGVDVYSIVDQLESTVPCPSYAVRTATKHDTSKGSSCPVAIGHALIDMYEELQDELFGDDCDDEDSSYSSNETFHPVEQEDAPGPEPDQTAYAKCPQCGGMLVFEGGCNTCKDCGWSKCD